MAFIINYIKNGMILDPGYPASIQVPHSMWAICSYRNSFSEKEWKEVPYTQKMIGSYFCHTYGGTVFRDLCLGLAPTLIAHPTVSKYWLTTFLLTTHLPGDPIFTIYKSKGSFLRIIMRGVEAIDASTTICSSYEKGLRLHPVNILAPAVVGISSGIGGSVFRYLERNGRSDVLKKKTKTEWCHPTGSIERVVSYVIVYSMLRKFFGDYKMARLIVVTYHVLKEVLEEIFDRKIDPGAYLGKLLFKFLNSYRPIDRFKRPGLTPTANSKRKILNRTRTEGTLQ